MIQLQLTTDAVITIETGKQLTARPRILLDGLKVIISNSNSLKDLDAELTDSIGSDEGWLHLTRVDTLAFDPSTRLLRTVKLYYSENNQIPGCLPLPAETEKVTGIPRLTESTEQFEMESFEFRHYHIEGNRLFGFNEDFLTAKQLLEVIVSNDLSLFFLNGRYCAWGLYHPETRLVNRIVREVNHTSDAFLKTALRDAFELICDETVKRMNEKDEDILQQLAALHNRIAAHAPGKESPLDVLNEWLFELADKFYWRRGINNLLAGRNEKE